jgi:N-methylhydantoinase B
MRPLEIIAPRGTVVNALPPAAVCGGNVETSQRIVDVLYKCLAKALPDRIPAASQGTMNNVTFGGMDPRTREPFAYYETVCGGMGARPGMNGISGVHTHMTNSMNTPVEAFEHDYPVRIVRYGLRKGSGGSGRHSGGDGVVREIQFHARSADRPVGSAEDGPYGLQGGRPGCLVAIGSSGSKGASENLSSKCTVWVGQATSSPSRPRRRRLGKKGSDTGPFLNDK